MGTNGKTISGGIPGSGKDIISGGHGAGRYGQPHRFYGKSAAKYKGPHKQLEGLLGPEKAKTMVKGPDGKMVPDYAVDGKGSSDLAPKKMSQDHKMAYDRSEISRLKKDIHFDDMKKKGEGPGKIKKDKQKISKLQDDVLAGAAKYKYGKK
jgi:hypothetical protein